MGLLDDAIREHLELKRLRGADPGVVAREEQDVLGLVQAPGDDAYDGSTDGGPSLRTYNDELLPASDSSPTADLGSVGQETVEINMEAELAAEDEDDFDSQPEAERDTRAKPVPHPASARTISEESLEWEVPDEPVERAGLDEERTPATGEDLHQAGPVEDVLEETPDFLRETPEQERLWFEQRPPRDFDFND
jgi:hypothetical protein